MATQIIENRTITDYQTGEVIESDTTRRYKTEEPDYVKLYIDAWCSFKNVKGISTNFLFALLPYMSYSSERNLIQTTPYLKRLIADHFGWAPKHALTRFNVELAKLRKAGVVKRLGASAYQINPELIGKGEWKDIKKLRATFNLETGEVSTKYEK